MFYEYLNENPKITDFKQCQYGQTIIINVNKFGYYDGDNSCIHTFIAYHKLNDSIVVAPFQRLDQVFNLVDGEMENVCIDPDNVFLVIQELMNIHLNRALNVYKDIFNVLKERKDCKFTLSNAKKTHGEAWDHYESLKMADEILRQNDVVSNEAGIYLDTESYKDSKRKIIYAEDALKKLNRAIESYHNRIDINLKAIMKLVNHFDFPAEKIKNQIYYAIKHQTKYQTLKNNNFYHTEDLIKI